MSAEEMVRVTSPLFWAFDSTFCIHRLTIIYLSLLTMTPQSSKQGSNGHLESRVSKIDIDDLLGCRNI